MNDKPSNGRDTTYARLTATLGAALLAYRFCLYQIAKLRAMPQQDGISRAANWLEIVLFAVIILLTWIVFRKWRAAARRHQQIEENQRAQSQLLADLQKKYNQLKELEDLRDNLTYMIVHDLKTPLTAVSGYLEILKRYSAHKLDEKERGYLIESSKQASRLAGMIASVLDVTKMESNQMTLNLEPCDLVATAEAAVDLLGAPARRIVTVEPAARPIIAFFDSDVIERVILNLVDNAVKSVETDGKVRVVIEQVEEKAKISVIDNGAGIPAEYHTRIFERFGRVKDQKRSTGLGLTFCKLAVKAHNCDIKFQSEVGKGSIFWFFLPLLPPAK